MTLLNVPNAMKNIAGLALTRYAPAAIRHLAPVEVKSKFRITANPSFIDIQEKASLRGIRISRQNAVYLLDMMNSFDYYFQSTSALRVRKFGEIIDLVDFSTPRFHQINGFSDFPVMCSSLTEPFVTAEQYLEFARLQPGDVAIDLGSYSCLTSVAFSKAVGASGKVIAIEPDPLNYSCCQTNISQHGKVNKLNNIELLNIAVSGEDSFLEFSSEGAMGSSAANLGGTYRGDVIKVPCKTLGSLASQLNLQKVDFIKMDIEGSELEVIRSSKSFFEKFKPRIIIEPHVVNGALSDGQIINDLTHFGYDCSVIQQTGVEIPLVTGTPRQ